MMRLLWLEAALLIGVGFAAGSQMRIQVVDEASLTPLERVTVTLQSGEKPKVRTTDGQGIVNFGPAPDGDLVIQACRPDLSPSGSIRWNDLKTVNERSEVRILKLKASTTRQDCFYPSQGGRRRASARR